MRSLILFLLVPGAVSWAAEAAGQGPVLEAPAAFTAPATAATPTWSGEAEAGFVATGGNTQTQSVNTRLSIKRNGPRWDNRLNAEYLEASDGSRTTAERTTASFESHYLLNERNYLFGVARYEADRFSGYERQLSGAAGYGRRFLLSTATTLETEAGGGERLTRSSDGTRRSDVILRIALKFRHDIGAKSFFKEEAFTEIARDNTHTESATSVTARIDGNLSLKAAFTAIDNSGAAPGVKRTDTITSVTLVFDFGS